MILNRTSSVVQSRIGPANASIQQIKAAGLTSRGATTQGLPQPVSDVSITVGKSGTNRTLRVTFIENPSDPYFVTAHAYLQQGTGNPTLIASGTSPITATLAASNIPAVIIVVSAGNWGTTPLDTSPSKAVSLA